MTGKRKNRRDETIGDLLRTAPANTVAKQKSREPQAGGEQGLGVVKAKGKKLVKRDGDNTPARTPGATTAARRGRRSSYKLEFCDMVRKLGDAGLSKEEMPARLCVRPETLDDWAAAHAEFAEAMEFALTCAQAYWERLGRHGIWMGEDFNGDAWISEMKRRFPTDYR